MLFTIDAECTRGLRIIREFPDFDVGRIEGYNGIGKSSALHLLELCAGGQPYRQQPDLWTSFRKQLQRATVRVTGLHGDAAEIVWEISNPSSGWPKTPDPLGEDLGTVTIDGRRATCRDTESLLHVATILGNETFTATLAARLELASARLKAWLSHDSGTGWERMETLDRLLTESADAIAARGPAELKELQLQRATAEAKNREATFEAERIGTRVSALSEAVRLAGQLDDIRGRGPELSGQLAGIEHQQEVLAAERSALDLRITETGRREHQDEAARHKFTLARQLADKRERELRDCADRLNDAAAEAGTTPDPAQIEALTQQLSRKLDELTGRLPAINASPFMAGLLSDIADRLRTAEAAGLAEEVLIGASAASPGWTVKAWREVCEQEAASRAAEGATVTAQEVETSIAEVRNRLHLLASAAELSIRVTQAAENKQRASQRLAAAIENLPPEEAVTLDQLVSAREATESQLAELAERHAAVQHALSLVGGGVDESTLREQLARICDETGVPESRLRSQLATEQQRLASAQEAVAASGLAAGTARREADESAATVGAALTALREHPQLTFARNAASGLMSMAATSDADRAAALSALRTAMDGAQQSTHGARGQIQSIAAALDAVAAQFRQVSKPVAGTRWLKPVQKWLGSQVAEWFTHAEVREALFPHGQDISVDIEGMAVSWTSRGEPMTRPMTAFSSGQQALAYTRARMAPLDSAGATAANRLIALDEFGAYIAADGMRHLSRYLVERRETFPHDQVVLVLPLREDIQHKPDPADTAATRQWRRLQDWGYLAERITG